LYSLTGIPRSALTGGLIFQNTVYGQLVSSEAGGSAAADPCRMAGEAGDNVEEDQEQEEPLDLRKTPNLVLTQGKNFLN
jgi:hypothetical protein